MSSQQSYWLLYQGANSVNDVIAIVPQDYRHVFQKPLLGVAQTAKKANTSRATIAKWEQHQAAGIYLPHLKSKMPQIQLSKGFREIAEAKAAANTLD